MPVHRLHYLLFRFGNVFDVFLQSISALGMLSAFTESLASQLCLSRYNTYTSTHYIKQMKRFINHHLSFADAELVTLEMATRFNVSLTVENVYLTEEQIVEIYELGHEIGSHSHRHVPLSTLSASDQNTEICASYNYFSSLLPIPPQSFCYPYGRPTSYNEATIRTLKKLGYINALSVEDASIETATLNLQRYYLPRYDCNSLDSFPRYQNF